MTHLSDNKSFTYKEYLAEKLIRERTKEIELKITGKYDWLNYDVIMQSWLKECATSIATKMTDQQWWNFIEERK